MPVDLSSFCQVPWSKLGKEPVVAEFDRLYIVACPREDDSESSSCSDSADTAQRAEEIEADAKRQRVAKAEEAWLEVSSGPPGLFAGI